MTSEDSVDGFLAKWQKLNIKLGRDQYSRPAIQEALNKMPAALGARLLSFRFMTIGQLIDQARIIEQNLAQFRTREQVTTKQAAPSQRCLPIAKLSWLPARASDATSMVTKDRPLNPVNAPRPPITAANPKPTLPAPVSSVQPAEMDPESFDHPLTNDKPIDVDPGASCRLLIHRQLAQTLIKSGCYHAPVAYPTKICGYNGSGPQSITHKMVTKLSVPGTSFTDSTCSFSIIDMAQRSYQNPRPPPPPVPHAEPEPERNSEPAVPSLPKLPTKILKRGEPLPEPPIPEPSRPSPSTKAQPMGLKQFKRMVNRTRGEGRGIAVIFNEPDPDTVIASLAPALPGSAIAAITQADIESHRANKEKPKTDPRAKLPKEYHSNRDSMDMIAEAIRWTGLARQ
ncbi:hypothetical protein V8E54_008386 [Elaphomyces granulatus]